VCVCSSCVWDLFLFDVFPWHSYKNTNTVFRLVSPVCAMNTYILNVHVFTNQAPTRFESRICVVAPRIQHAGWARVSIQCRLSKGFALTWYRALSWYSSSARPFAALDDPQLVTGQQGSPSPACRQLSRAQNVCAGGLKRREYQVKARYQVGANACCMGIQLN